MLRLPNFLVLSLTAAVALTSCTDIEDEILIEFCPVEWNIPEDITSAGGVCSEPCVAAGLGDIIHIAWSKKYGAGVHEIHLVNSTDCFATTTRISHLGIYSEYPSIAVDSGGIVHAVWRATGAGGTHDIYYANSTDWQTTTVKVSSGDYGGARAAAPVIVTDSNNRAHLSWDELTADLWDVYYASSEDLSSRVNVSDSVDPSWCPSVAVGADDVIYVAWTERVDDVQCEVYYADSSDWAGTLTNASNTQTQSAGQSIAVDAGDNIHIVWHEYEGSFPVYNEWIVYANSTDWGCTQLFAHKGGGLQSLLDPQLAVDREGIAHIVWQEWLDADDAEIMYANSTHWGLTRRNISRCAGRLPGYARQHRFTLDSNGAGHVVWEYVCGPTLRVHYSTTQH